MPGCELLSGQGGRPQHRNWAAQGGPGRKGRAALETEGGLMSEHLPFASRLDPQFTVLTVLPEPTPKVSWGLSPALKVCNGR